MYVQDTGDNVVMDTYKKAEGWNSFLEYKTMKTISELKSEKQDIVYHMLGQEIQLSATIYPEDATLPYLFWYTSNPEVATVDHNGMVRINKNIPDADRECVITARTLYREGPELSFTIRPADVLYNKLCIKEIESNVIDAGEEIQLFADPDSSQAPEMNFEWTTSDSSIASVDQNGLVTGLRNGEVEISVIITFDDGLKVSDNITLKVNPPLTGDSNLDHSVSITDAVCTANYAIGNEVKRFSVDAADIDRNGKITIADATGTVTLILNGSIVKHSFTAHPLSKSATSADLLEIGNYSPGASSRLPIRLTGSGKYVAMQADITLPDGVEIEDIVAGEGISHKHTLAYQVSMTVVCVLLFLIPPTINSMPEQNP